ncbi:MAG: heavy metal translocating P-type ATPase, partial [Myxococcaceae bacterium]
MSEQKKSGSRFGSLNIKGLKVAQGGNAVQRHVHGPGCDHDHGSGHDHPGHDHGHAHAHGEAHEHGPSCSHGHGHDHHGHDHHGHAHSQRVIRPPAHRPAEGGGTALQLDLEGTLPGETDEQGRFARLEAALESQRGITDVHLRRDAGHAEVCIHYQPSLVSASQLVTLARKMGGQVAARYLHHTWFVRGMDSADAAQRIEHAVSRIQGVLTASVAYASERVVIEYDKEALKLSDVEARVKALGYGLEVPMAGHACSHHAHGGGLAPLLELPLVVASGVLLAAGFVVEHFALAPPLVATVLWALSMASGGFFAIKGSVQS